MKIKKIMLFFFRLQSHAVHQENVSPFRRWGQSSFRSRSNESKVAIQRRPTSLGASENDVYSKVYDFSFINNIL